MTCDQVRRELTAYLDGELAADRGSAVRGHLRGCAACRAIASDEATLRDGLRSLPPVDPPPSLWGGVLRQLAAAEVADAERPAWRRAVARWMPYASRTGLAGAALAAAAGLLIWRAHRHDDLAAVASAPSPTVEHAPPAPPPRPPALAQPGELVGDVELAAEPARKTAAYAQATRELLAAAEDARGRWTDDRKRTFDAKVAQLRARIDRASEGRPRQAAYRELDRYLQNAAIRDEISANDRVLAGACP
jgi:hypothetical protein